MSAAVSHLQKQTRVHLQIIYAHYKFSKFANTPNVYFHISSTVSVLHITSSAASKIQIIYALNNTTYEHITHMKAKSQLSFSIITESHISQDYIKKFT